MRRKMSAAKKRVVRTTKGDKTKKLEKERGREGTIQCP